MLSPLQLLVGEMENRVSLWHHNAHGNSNQKQRQLDPMVAHEILWVWAKLGDSQYQKEYNGET